MTDKKLILLFILLLIPLATAFKPVTHYYTIYSEWQNKDMALGAVLPDIAEITQGAYSQRLLHSSDFLTDFGNIATTEEQKNFYQGYYHHTRLDLEEDIYSSKEKKEKLKQLSPGYDNQIYEEALSYAVETIIIEKDPSIIGKIVDSLEKQELLDYYAQILKRKDAGDKERVERQKQNLLIYLSAIQAKDYELILEEQTEKERTTQEWNQLIKNAISVAKEDNMFQFLENFNIQYLNESNKRTGIKGFVEPKINLAIEKPLDKAVADAFIRDSKAIEQIVGDYDDKLWIYIQQKPEQILPLAKVLITQRPLFTLKLLFTTKAGISIIGVGALLIFLISSIIIHFVRKSGTDNFLGMSTTPLHIIHDKFKILKETLQIPKIIMYVGIVLFTFSLVYDLISQRSMLFGLKQMIGITTGIILVIIGFFFTGHSVEIKFLPENIQVFMKSASYLILSLGLMIAVISVFYDFLVGRTLFFGIKQFFMLVVAILIIFIAYLMKR